MSQIIAAPMKTLTTPSVDEPMPRLWTREEYYRMGDLDFFHGQRVELIEGEIVVFSPQKWPHSSNVDRVGDVLRRALGAGFWTRMQLPINLGTSDPEPDVSVVLGRREDYSDHPTTAVLIVEVSDTSLRYDRTRKASLYARAGIADYWIVNLVDRQLEVRRDPRLDPSQHYGHGYANVAILVPPAVVSPLPGFALHCRSVALTAEDVMSGAIATSPQVIFTSQPVEPTPRLWTREEYYRLGDLGFFDGQRVELIEGEIVVLSPQKAEHWTNTDRVAELLRSCFGSGYHVRMQGPIDFGPSSEPEPDVAVVAGSREQYAAHHPQTAVLIVEISESRLNYDRTRKASLYARAGIADYWIVNLVDRQLEVRRDPRPDPSQHYGHGYANVAILVPPTVVNPLAAPQISLSVADLLP